MEPGAPERPRLASLATNSVKVLGIIQKFSVTAKIVCGPATIPSVQNRQRIRIPALTCTTTLLIAQLLNHPSVPFANLHPSLVGVVPMARNLGTMLAWRRFFLLLLLQSAALYSPPVSNKVHQYSCDECYWEIGCSCSQVGNQFICGFVSSDPCPCG